MENVVLMADRTTQFGDRSKHRARGRRIKPLVDPQIGLHLLVELQPKISPELAHQYFGAGHFVFAESIKNTHAIRRRSTLSFSGKMGKCGYFRYCVGCGPFSRV